MHLVLDKDELRAVVKEVVRETLAEVGFTDGRLAISERDAAKLLSVPVSRLRDARRRDEIHATKIGKGYVYSQADILEFLNGNGRPVG